MRVLLCLVALSAILASAQTDSPTLSPRPDCDPRPSIDLLLEGNTNVANLGGQKTGQPAEYSFTNVGTYNGQEVYFKAEATTSYRAGYEAPYGSQCCGFTRGDFATFILRPQQHVTVQFSFWYANGQAATLEDFYFSLYDLDGFEGMERLVASPERYIVQDSHKLVISETSSPFSGLLFYNKAGSVSSPPNKEDLTQSQMNHALVLVYKDVHSFDVYFESDSTSSDRWFQFTGVSYSLLNYCGDPTLSPTSTLPTVSPTTTEPTEDPTSSEPTGLPITSAPSTVPTDFPTDDPTTSLPTTGPTYLGPASCSHMSKFVT
jgi:hypothetical protein